MKHILIILLAAFSAVVCRAASPSYTDENLSYKVTYKWGLIQKQAGSAEFVLKKDHTGYNAELTARTLPWADHIFQVRDTLRSRMRLGDMAPLMYNKATDEGGVYRNDLINYTYGADNVITAKCHRYKKKKNSPAEVSDTILSAPAPGTDMLSVYYLVRKLPFETMKPGTVAYAKIFSGKKIEDLGVTYNGIETVKLNGRKYECYKISFTFSSARIKNSSAPMTAWISTEPQRVPVKLQGELPIGKIQVLLDSAR